MNKVNNFGKTNTLEIYFPITDSDKAIKSFISDLIENEHVLLVRCKENKNSCHDEGVIAGSTRYDIYAYIKFYNFKDFFKSTEKYSYRFDFKTLPNLEEVPLCIGELFEDESGNKYIEVNDFKVYLNSTTFNFIEVLKHLDV